jgi:hypothetical protein
MLKNFYNMGNFGSKGSDNFIKNRNFNNFIYSDILNRIKQPIRVYLKEKTPYSRYNYVIIHQKLLNIYLNKKIKYNKIRFLIKPLQMYFRDFFRFMFDLKNINYISRNQINIINLELFSKYSIKYKVSRVKKIILNARILYRKNKKISKNNYNFYLFYNFYNYIILNIYNNFFGESLTTNQIKKIIK